MNAAKRALTRTQQFVSDHKVAIAVTATATAGVVFHMKVIKDVNARLKELGVYEQFWSSTEDHI